MCLQLNFENLRLRQELTLETREPVSFKAQCHIGNWDFHGQLEELSNLRAGEGHEGRVIMIVAGACGNDKDISTCARVETKGLSQSFRHNNLVNVKN